MSYTNGTPFLNLPQTIGSDHRDWFDTNEPFLDLDNKMKTLWDDSGSTASAIDALQELTATLQTDLTTLSGTVNTHTSALSTINEALVLINGTLATLNTSVATKFDSAGIADPYDADHGIYAIGDVVTYNGQRYVCSTAVTAAEPFDADKWTAEDVQTVIDSIKLSLTVKSVVAEGTTVADKLTNLATVFSSLTNEQKHNSKLVLGSSVLSYSTNAGGFGGVYVNSANGTVNSFCANLDGVCRIVNVATDGTVTNSDYSALTTLDVVLEYIL